MKLCQLTQGTKIWLEWRRNMIMASDSSILLGISPYKTIQELYHEKIHKYESVCTPIMQRGKDLEPIALEKFEKETGLILFPAVAVHDTIEWMAASFDGVTICRDAIVEIKCNGKKNHELSLKGKIPNFHNCQVQHQIEVSGLDFAYYYSFDGENGVIIEVKRDQEFIDIMLEKEREFWNSLQALTLSKNGNEYATRVIP